MDAADVSDVSDVGDVSDVKNGSKRQRWALGLLLSLAAAVGLKTWVEWHRVPEVSGLGAPAEPATPASAEAPQWGEAAVAAARVGRAASAALATARTAAGLAPKPPAEVVMNLCGVGRMTIPAAPAAAAGTDTGPSQSTLGTLPEPLGKWALNEAWARLLTAMDDAAQPDRIRAAAQVLRAGGVEHEGTEPVPAEMQAAARKLARLARRTDDATVMTWALAVCQRTVRPDANANANVDCRRITARDLTRLAPEDASSWISLAALPKLAAAERESAWERAAKAPRWSGTEFRLAQALDEAWPAGLPDYLRVEMSVAAIGVEVALPDRTGWAILRLCSAQSLQQPDLRARCEALARNLQANGGSMRTQGLASGLGARLGWPEAELAAMQEESTTLSENMGSLLPRDQPYACPAVEDLRQYIGSVADVGELQTLRRRLAAQPMTPKPAASKP